MPSKIESGAKRKWRPAPQTMIDHFERVTASFPEAEKRRMFGFPCVFAHGNMFAGLHQEDFVLRLPEKDREVFLRLKGARPFEPMPGRVMSEYVVVPQDILRSEALLGTWFNKAFTYALSLPPKKKKVK